MNIASSSISTNHGSYWRAVEPPESNWDLRTTQNAPDLTRHSIVCLGPLTRELVFGVLPYSALACAVIISNDPIHDGAAQHETSRRRSSLTPSVILQTRSSVKTDAA